MQAILDELRKEKEGLQAKCTDYEKEIQLLKSSKTVLQQHAAQNSIKNSDQISSSETNYTINQTKSSEEITKQNHKKINRYEKSKCKICNQPPFGLMV